ncbi:hypothetical protein [Nocardiopsis ansamitocini]|uniref:Uncharacterized protein n=1 Tax=Nocardiopsis ansamitocini TaxID=1670832 RepID=A0A9W6P6S1_9ACTN|nr:hypothetical protein [Nocardiopsis ansamitocini]GLU48038.1 hypothetical protein Nans01_23890 [Nocardiopsis ansamitocini]
MAALSTWFGGFVSVAALAGAFVRETVSFLAVVALTWFMGAEVDVAYALYRDLAVRGQ